MGDDHEYRGEGGEGGREHLGAFVSAKFSGDFGKEDNGEDSGDETRESDSPEGFSEYCVEGFEDEDGEWGVVYVSPGEVIGAGKVIEFVSEVAVVIESEEVEYDADCGDGDDAGEIELVAV